MRFIIICCSCILLPVLLLSQEKAKEDEAYAAFAAGNYLKSEQIWKEIAQNSIKNNDHKQEVKALLEIVRSGMHISKYEASVHYAKEAARKAKNNKFISEYGQAMSTLATIFEFLDQKDSILIACQEVLSMKGLPPNFYSDAYSSLSMVYQDKGEIDNEEMYIKKAIEMDRLHQDSSSLPFNLVNFGKLKIKSNQYKEALSLFFEAESFLRKDVDKFKYPSVYTNISSLFRTLQNFDKSHEYGMKALKACEELNLTFTKVKAYNQLGATAQRQKKYDEALEYYLRCDSIYALKGGRMSFQIGVKTSIAECLLALKRMNEANNIINEIRPVFDSIVDNRERLAFSIVDAENDLNINPSLALPKLNKAKKYCDNLNNKYAENKIYGLYAQYYTQIKDYKKSLFYSGKADKLKDEIYRSEQSFVVHNLEALYKKKEQEGEIKLLAAQNDLQNSQLQKQRVVIWSTIIGLVLFGVLFSFIVSLLRKVRSQKTIVEKSLDEKEVLLKEIHHRVKNNLQVISSLLALQSKYINDDTALSALKQGQDRVFSMSLIHQFLYQGENLIGVDTISYFEQLLDNLLYSYNLDEEIKLNLDVESMQLDVDTMIPIGLIVNELVSNAFKHAFNNNHHSAAIDISLLEKNDLLILEVKDNGDKILNTDEIKGKSFGFELIQAFSKKLRAKIEMKVDHGLSVKLHIGKYNRAA